MKYVFTFNEINYGRIEIEADHKPDNGEIIEKILEGKADYHSTDFTDFCLVEADGKTEAVNAVADKTTVWSKYLLYLRGWADTHREPVCYGMTPTCFDGWYGCEYQDGTDSNDSYRCCLHETPRSFEWCEKNCDRYRSCDTVAMAGDELNEDE